MYGRKRAIIDFTLLMILIALAAALLMFGVGMIDPNG